MNDYSFSISLTSFGQDRTPFLQARLPCKASDQPKARVPEDLQEGTVRTLRSMNRSGFLPEGMSSMPIRSPPRRVRREG